MWKFIPVNQRNLIDKIKEAGLNKLVVSSNMNKVAEQHRGSGSIEYARLAKKRHPDNEIIVPVACSSYEFYGPNSNGDGFPSEKAYPEYDIKEKDLLRNNYKTFEDAQVYYMHDMGNAIGWVLKAFWNDRYKWVELVVELDHERCPKDVFEKLKKGEMIFVSMGCVIPYDVCTICGNKSEGQGAYCEHIKNNLLDVIDDKISAMLNPSPRFDDISLVFIPAEALAGSIYRKAASGISFVRGVGGTTKLAEMHKKLCKIAEIYKNTRDLKAISGFKECYTPLVDRMNEGMKDGMLDSVVFFYKNAVPMPVVALAEKYDIGSDKVLRQQSDLITLFLKEGDLSGLVESSAAGEKGALGELCSRLNATSDMAETEEKDALARVLALFNIINKLKVSEEGLEPGMLSYDVPESKDIKSIIELEFLTGVQ